MYTWGQTSRRELASCDKIIRATFEEALRLGLVDIAVVEGHRGMERQNELFELKMSKLEWPNSDHNSYPSLAVDAYPFVNGEISYKWEHCIFLAGVIQATSKTLYYNGKIDGWLGWGGNWDRDGEVITDQDFQDLGHFEVVFGIGR